MTDAQRFTYMLGSIGFAILAVAAAVKGEYTTTVMFFTVALVIAGVGFANDTGE